MATDQKSCTELSDGQIRLLHLAPGSATEDLHGRLEVVNIRDPGDYTALSYAWGTRTPDKKLHLPVPLSITPTLWSALCRVRSHSETLRVWADAICINQNDASEKAKQVMAMKMIFQHARLVVVDLGEEGGGSEALLPKLSAVPTIRNLRKYPLGTILPLSSLSENEQTRDSLIKLLERNWFKRCWIFQEVIVASEIDIMCGTWRQPWQALLFMTMALDFRGEKGHASYHRSELERIRARVLQMNNMRARFKRKDEITLETVLFHNRYSKASDPRDHVYALLGLCGLEREVQLQVDYTEHSSATFLRYGQYIIQHGSALRLLYLNQPSLQRDDLPSWLCDWSRTADEDESYKTDLFALDRPIFAAGISKPPSIRLEGSHSIKAKGVLLTYIQEVGEDLTAAKRIIAERDTRLAISSLDEMNMTKFLKLPETSREPPGTAGASKDRNDSPPGLQKRTGNFSTLSKLVGAASIYGPSTFSIQESKLAKSEDRLDSHFNTVLLCKAGRLTGQVPRGTVVNDVIVILYGSQLPFVLRPFRNAWKFVGSAYIEGMMDGEALESSDYKVTDFLIV